MRILSLETKKHLMGWGVVLGFIVNVFVAKYSFISAKCDLGALLGICPPFESYGWPIKIHPYNEVSSPNIHYVYIANLIIWILMVLFILSFARHFRKK